MNGAQTGQLVQIDGLGRADGNALAAAITVGTAIDDVTIGSCTRGQFVGGLAHGKTPLVSVWQFHRANLGTVVAVYAAVRVHVAWFLAQRHGEITRLTFNIDDVRIGQYLNIGMLVVLDIGWRDRGARTTIAMIRRSSTENTIMLGKHIAQLSNPPSQVGRLFNQVYLQTHIGQVQG